MASRRLACRRPRFVYRRRPAAPRPLDVGRIAWLLKRSIEELRRYTLANG